MQLDGFLLIVFFRFVVENLKLEAKSELKYRLRVTDVIKGTFKCLQNIDRKMSLDTIA